MDVKEAIETRRAYRSLDPVQITPDIINDLATHAGLSMSCFNNQPWSFCFVYDPKKLEEMHEVMSQGNEWTFKASCIVAVFTKVDKDCVIHDREYYLFDTGMAVAFLILRATELGLVAHPIAGYSPKKTRAVLGIPDDYQIITLVNIGKHSMTLNQVLSEKQIADESRRPLRMPLEKFVHHNAFNPLASPDPPKPAQTTKSV